MADAVLPFISSDPFITGELHNILPDKNTAYDLVAVYCE